MSTRTTVFATNDVLSANDLNALAGAWNSYTPTLAGFTQGDATMSGAYLRFGKLVLFRARCVFGTTTVANATPAYLSLPVTALSSGDLFPLRGYAIDAGTARYTCGVYLSDANAAGVMLLGTNSVHAAFSSTSPFTWTTGDEVGVSGIYEAA